MIRYQKFSIFI